MDGRSILIGSIVLHGAFLAWAIGAGTDWLSPILMFVIFALVYVARNGFGFGAEELLVLHVPLVLQNLGAVTNLYEINQGIFGYDWIMHLASPAAAAYILFSAHVHTTQVRLETRKRQIALHALVVVSLVLFFGVIVEIIEFGGYLYGGEGEGFLDGPGNPDYIAGLGDGQYGDTGFDLINNVVGATLGATLYLALRRIPLQAAARRKQ